MEFFFVGVACTDEAIKESNYKYYNNNATVRPQQYFDLNLVQGLSQYSNVIALSEPPVSSFPNSKCLFYRRKEDKVSQNLTIEYIPLINLLVLKTIMISLYILIKSFAFSYRNRNKEKAIVLGNLSFYTAFPVLLIARIFKVKVITIVPDLPVHASRYNQHDKSVIKSHIHRVSDYFNDKIESQSDGYVFLTEQMNELINVYHKPYEVIEGFINIEDFNIDESDEKRLKVVMYAGTLHKKFGINKLIKAFSITDHMDYELWIYGTGDYLSEIQSITKVNSRIIYKGTLTKKEMIELEAKVTLLVNCRPTDEEFTKYSFPSKTLEYMASGTPLLTTKLVGIPDEYFKYLHVFDSEEIHDMSLKLSELLNYPSDTINEFGKQAKAFVLNNKTNIIQAEKLYNFLKEITNNQSV